jgi:hypothetical protein
MHEDELVRGTAFIIRGEKDGWFVALPDKTLLGPFKSGDLALEAAVTQALLARQQGFVAQIYVEDNRGGRHGCMILEHMNDPHRCARCQASWSSSGPPVQCLLRSAISKG